MTGRLGLMMKLHDAQVADDVRRMAELGYFDTEFTMYGCAYVENDRRYYKISPNAEDIYSFIEKSNLQSIFPSNVYEYTKKCPVPAGMKEVIAQDVKMELAKKIRDSFPEEFFVTLANLAGDVIDDSAAEYMWSMVDELEGVFDIERLRRFEEQMEYIYTCRKITWETFKNLRVWLKDERKSMLENFETKDIFEKIIYGMSILMGIACVMWKTHAWNMFMKDYMMSRARGAWRRRFLREPTGTTTAIVWQMLCRITRKPSEAIMIERISMNSRSCVAQMRTETFSSIRIDL